MLTDETAPLEEVAQALGRSPAWLKRHWLRLHQEQNFPRKIPTTGFVWPRRAVEVWLRSAGASAPLPANQNGHEQVDAISAAAAALRARYGASS